MKSLEGGLNIIEGNSGAGKPEPMNFTNTPAEVFKFLGMLEQSMETLSGISSVTRGNPEASLKSGSALALVQSMSLQFISGLQQQYIHLIEDVGTGVVNMLRDFAAVPRIVYIAGIENKNYVQQEFTGDDLSQVNRVIVDVGNPIAKTTAGKMQMATDLIQYGLVKNPDEYFTVLTSGQLNTITDGPADSSNLIRQENEAMLQGKPVIALAVDEHINHINGHKGVLNDPTIRQDKNLTEQVLNHILEHYKLLQETDPNLLVALGQQPLSPPGGTPPAPQDNINQSAPPQLPQQPAEQMPNPPNMPNMPTVPAEVLPNPELQQQAMNNVR
jgi:hypothetical protein